ncbi:hypothetical protein SAMN05660657_04689 [Geodermatophilus amargosae]|uniref:Uncharacterized protein n=1 Tax=Geodermatophilus amargosae TaxID=1296565 RepID=A0A1I7CNM2_9ACTN|nr:hypothetical protein SAMN05660657_04689 [Geodermatophilus amargosae]
MTVRHHDGVRTELSDGHWRGVQQGWLVGPDGRRYVRRTTRTRRKEGDRLVVDGAPLVLVYWAGNQLDRLDGIDAHEQWQTTRPRVTTEEPRRKGDIEWTAGRWEDDEGRPLLLLTGHC